MAIPLERPKRAGWIDGSAIQTVKLTNIPISARASDILNNRVDERKRGEIGPMKKNPQSREM